MASRQESELLTLFIASQPLDLVLLGNSETLRTGENFRDRIQLNSILVVLCFIGVLSLSSQSAASYPSYLLAISMLISIRQWNDVFTVRLMWAISLLVVYLCLTSFWSSPFMFRDTLGIFSRGLLVLLFVVAVAECQLRGQVQIWLGRALGIVGIAAAVAALIVFYRDPPVDGRLQGLGQLDNSVVLGLVMGAVLIILVEIGLNDTRRLWQAVGWIGSVSVLVVIALSGSRNAWMSTMFGLIVLLASWRVLDRQKFLSAVAVLMVMLLSVVLAVSFTEQGNDLLLPRGDSFRPEIWAQVFERVIAQSPLIGLGITTPDQVQSNGIVFAHPHNMYLAVFFQGGVAALLLLVIVIAWALAELYEGYSQRSAKLGLGLISMALVSYVLDGHELIDKVGETWFLFWLPIGISLGLAWSRDPYRQHDPW